MGVTVFLLCGAAYWLYFNLVCVKEIQESTQRLAQDMSNDDWRYGEGIPPRMRLQRLKWATGFMVILIGIMWL